MARGRGSRRGTVGDVGGRWLVETLWFDDDCATAAGDERSPATDAFDALIESGSDQTLRWSTLD
jgi:hypothetical protein